MKRLWIAILSVLPALLLGVAAATASTTTARSASTALPKLTICHKTGSASNPWRRITVAGQAMAKPKTTAGRLLRAHLRHTGDATVVGTGACPTPTATPAPSSTPPAKITICHRTGSKSTPYRKITVSSRSITNPQSQSGKILRGHMRHVGDLLLPGASACPTGTPASQVVRLTAALQPVSGATGSGTANVTIWLTQQRLCASLTVSGLTDVTGAHIHRASTNAIVVPLATPTNGSSNGCVNADGALLKEIASSPSAFYVNVHTATYPAGQISGTLAPKK